MTRRNSTLSSRVGSPRASAPAPRIALPDFPADLTVKPGKLQKGTNQDAIGHGKIQIDPYKAMNVTQVSHQNGISSTASSEFGGGWRRGLGALELRLRDRFRECVGSAFGAAS